MSIKKTSSSFCFPTSKGFSLIELLVVIAIIGALATVTVPALSMITRSGSMNRAISGISMSLEQARAYAMANNTYVWVGFSPSTDSQQLTVGVIAGKTGDIGDLSSVSTYAPLTKLQTYDNMSLKSISGLSGMSASGDDISGSQIASFQQKAGGLTVNFNKVIQFSPSGEATIAKTSGRSHWIQIGLQPVIGSYTTDANVAVFQVASLTGQVQVFRP